MTEPETPASPPAEVTLLESEWEQLKKEVQEHKDKYLRLLAEQENMRKRLLKERDTLIQHAKDDLINDFLTPIDHLETALSITQNSSPEVKQWAIGFEMILGQFKEALENNGVKSFASIGHLYDPHFHEVIETIESTEHPPGTIIKEKLRGYRRGDKALRASHVVVAKEPVITAKEESTNEQ